MSATQKGYSCIPLLSGGLFIIIVFAGEERAIVSEIAGTTHDPVDKRIMWRRKHDITLIDTAGISRYVCAFVCV